MTRWKPKKKLVLSRGGEEADLSGDGFEKVGRSK